jgi:iron complex transport system permease protein
MQALENRPSSKYTRFLLGTFLLLLLSAFLTLMHGETPWEKIWEGILQRLQGKGQGWNPLLDERIPRLIILVCTGAALAVSGAVMQAIFHNPLASPSVLGISAGGCLSVILVLIFDVRIDYPYILPFAAFLGCLGTLCLVYGLSRCQNGKALTNLILTGIAISSLLLAFQGVLLYVLRDRWQLIQTITEWEAGSTIDRTWQHVHMQLPLTLVGLWGCWNYREELNIMALGDEEARALASVSVHCSFDRRSPRSCGYDCLLRTCPASYPAAHIRAQSLYSAADLHAGRRNRAHAARFHAQVF